jgi:hypothetical protein
MLKNWVTELERAAGGRRRRAGTGYILLIEGSVLTVSGPDTANRVLPRARRTVAGKNGGVLVPFSKDYQPPPGSNRPPTLLETLHLARKASPDAMGVLIANLRHEDPRVSTMSAQLILDRAWGKPKEQEQQKEGGGTIDLAALTSDELRVLMKLALSGRLGAAPTTVEPPTEIDAKVE